MINKPTFFEVENNSRSERYKKNETKEEILKHLNKVLLQNNRATFTQHGHLPNLLYIWFAKVRDNIAVSGDRKLP